MFDKLFDAATAMMSPLTGALKPTGPGKPLDWSAQNLKALDGKPIDPAQLSGKVVLLVNTASKCGLTPQYKALQSVWDGYKDKGLVVLGVPCNDFGGQEPGSADQIGAFCEKNYGVGFLLTEKQSVVGSGAAPIYQWATSEAGPLGTPRWNFHKFLIGKDGRLIDWFSSVTPPDGVNVRQAIEKALSV